MTYHFPYSNAWCWKRLLNCTNVKIRFYNNEHLKTGWTRTYIEWLEQRNRLEQFFKHLSSVVRILEHYPSKHGSLLHRKHIQSTQTVDDCGQTFPVVKHSFYAGAMPELKFASRCKVAISQWAGFPLYFGGEIQGLFKDFQGPWSCIFKDQFSTEVYSMDSITAIFNISFCDYGTDLVDKNKTWQILANLVFCKIPARFLSK